MTESTPNLKVLIICYYWPPAGGPGVQRWLKFIKYLREFQVEPVVYIPKNPTYPLVDESLTREILQDLEIISQPIFEPFGLAKFFSKRQTQNLSAGIIPVDRKQSLIQRAMLFVRGNFFIPDARKFWIQPSVKYLKDYLGENNVDAIITTGPPHSLHMIGQALRSGIRIPWIADFRDPWTDIGYHQKLKLTKKSQVKHLKFEHAVLDTADKIIVTSPTTLANFEAKTTTPIQCITNGFDVAHFPETPLSEKFTLSHIGSLLSGRNPLILWKVLSELKTENSDFVRDLELQLIGKVSSDILDTLNDFGLTENLTLKGYISHDEVLIAQCSAQILLLIEIDSEITKGIIPGKLFEYLAARRPILGIGPEQADFFDIVKKTRSGKTFNHQDYYELKRYLTNQYRKFKENGIPNTEGIIEQFTRKNLTGVLAETIRTIVEEFQAKT
ncbi:MAG: glycosyl transferase family 1 [Leeuwenhoekiella sp.]